MGALKDMEILCRERARQFDDDLALTRSALLLTGKPRSTTRIWRGGITTASCAGSLCSKKHHHKKRRERWELLCRWKKWQLSASLVSEACLERLWAWTPWPTQTLLRWFPWLRGNYCCCIYTNNCTHKNCNNVVGPLYEQNCNNVVDPLYEHTTIRGTHKVIVVVQSP